MKQLAAITAIALSGAPVAAQVACGGTFPGFVDNMKAYAVTQGHSPETVGAFLDGVAQDPKVLKADRAQGVFQLPFIDFSRRLISADRLEKGKANLARHAGTFERVEQTFGISPGVLLAFWAFETDYGAFQGDFNTLNALLTLSHDCRRPELFQPQVLAALELYERGDFDPATTAGAWAGEIGMVQMLPRDILENGTDGDGDGKVSLKTSVPDALMSGGAMLQSLGWRAGEPWLQEIVVPEQLDWAQTGLAHKRSVAEWEAAGVRGRNGSLGPAEMQASVLLPQGHKGPAFLAYPNFDVYFEWNQSMVYVTTAAYFATRLEGAQIYDAGAPDPGLAGDQMKALQEKLAAQGHDVGGVDGILGAGTRAAVQAEQERLGLPADAWPTQDLLNAL